MSGVVVIMNRRLVSTLLVVLILTFSASVCLAATVEGSGSQTRGTPGHNAVLSAKVFTLPSPGTIIKIESEGAGGFWIEREDGTLVVNFNSMKEANGYQLLVGKYRVLPNLRESPKADHGMVRVTFNY